MKDAHRSPDPHRTAVPHSRGFWVERVVGLGLVLISVVVFFAMTIPSLLEPWYFRAIVGAIAGVGVLVGLSLLVTGRVGGRISGRNAKPSRTG